MTRGADNGRAPAGGPATMLTLVRHGRTVWHSGNRYAGVSDVPLDGTGRMQARALGDWVRAHPHTAVACSPLSRARETAAAPAAALVERHRGGSVLVVAHNTGLRLALCAWLGLPLTHYRAVLPRLDNAAVTRLRVPADRSSPPSLLCLNVPTRAATPAVAPTRPPTPSHLARRTR